MQYYIIWQYYLICSGRLQQPCMQRTGLDCVRSSQKIIFHNQTRRYKMSSAVMMCNFPQFVDRYGNCQVTLSCMPGQSTSRISYIFYCFTLRTSCVLSAFIKRILYCIVLAVSAYDCSLTPHISQLMYPCQCKCCWVQAQTDRMKTLLCCLLRMKMH